MDNFTGFDSWLRMHDCCEATILDRTYVVTSFAGTHPNFPNCTPAQVTTWLGRPGFAQWTRSTYYGHLRSYFRWAAWAGLIPTDPMAGTRWPKRRKGAPHPLSHDEVKLVLAGANRNTHAWLTLGLYAGLRAHEVAKIRGQDVGEDRLFVNGKGDKDSWLPTHPLIWELARDRPHIGWWFPSSTSACGHVTSLSVSTLTSRLFTAHGIPGSIHRCRHTFATELLRAGVNIRVVQTLMRHESLASTELYLLVEEAERTAAIHLLTAA